MGEKMDTIKNNRPVLNSIQGKLPLIVFLLCVLQPFLDVAGYWQTTWGISNTVTMMLRMLLLGGSVLLGFLLSDRKRVYLLAAFVLLALTAGHAYACAKSPNGYRDMVTDLINLVRIYFLPMMTLCFITFLRRNEKVLPAIISAVTVNILLIAAVQLISTITGTDPHTYSVDHTGVRGWFMWTNSQSAILAMGCPVVICWALTRRKGRLLFAVLLTAVSEATLYFLAPRLAYASLIASGLGMAVCLLLIDRRRWLASLTVALVTVAFVLAYPVSPTHKRLADNSVRVAQVSEEIKSMDIHIETVVQTESQIETNPMQSELMTGSEDETAGANPTESTDNNDPSQTKPPKTVIKLDSENADKLEKLYRSHDILWSLVDRFGRDRVFEAYGYSLDPTVISSARTMKVVYCTLLMDESGTWSRLFGLNLRELLYQRCDKNGNWVYDNFDVENDLHGVYFLTGMVGLGLMILFLLTFGLRALLAVLRRPKKYFTLPMVAFSLSYGLGLIHAYFTASVLRRNNASIYLALVLACMWYLSRKQTDNGESQ